MMLQSVFSISYMMQVCMRFYPVLSYITGLEEDEAEGSIEADDSAHAGAKIHPKCNFLAWQVSINVMRNYTE